MIKASSKMSTRLLVLLNQIKTADIGMLLMLTTALWCISTKLSTTNFKCTTIVSVMKWSTKPMMSGRFQNRNMQLNRLWWAISRKVSWNSSISRKGRWRKKLSKSYNNKVVALFKTTKTLAQLKWQCSWNNLRLPQSI